MRKLTRQEFISRAKKIHGNKYNYKKVIYELSRRKVIIICPIHKNFKQTPIDHLSGRGCYLCGRHSSAIKNLNNAGQFIQKVKQIHENKYSYEKTEYKGVGLDIIVTCPSHGDFKQAARHHLSGSGCPRCYGRNKTSQDFIREAQLIHGQKYDYKKIKYNDRHTKVIIICRKHGEFKQEPSNHLFGKGCPICNESSGEKILSKYLKNFNPEFQKRFENCKDILPLVFDFCLSKQKILIEYQGEQHYRPMRFKNALKKFRKIQKHDRIKYNWVRRNGWYLIRVSYRIKNIESYLDNRLKQVLERSAKS